MDIEPTAISVDTCRFCLSPDQQTTSFFKRFDSEVVSSILHGLLGMQVDPSDEYSNICDICSSKLELMVCLTTEFRTADALFCSLLVEQQRLKDIEDDSRITIEVLEPNEHDFSGGTCSSDDGTVLQGSQNLSSTNTRSSVHEDDGDFLDEELKEEESYEEELHSESSDETDAPYELQQTGEERKCFLCNAFSGTHDAWSNHLQKVHSQMVPYRCEKCVIVLEDVRDLNDHFRTHQTPFGCLYCVEMFSSSAELDKHRTDCHGYRCDGCLKRFFYVSLLKEHSCTASREQKVHFINLLIGPKHKPNDVPFCCLVCNEAFARNANLAQHYEREHTTMSVTLHRCDVCPQKFTFIAAARKHRISHKKWLAPKKREANECSSCLKSFKFNHQLLEHMEQEHADVTVTLYQCAKCDRKYTTEGKLQRHDYNMHQDRQPRYFCSFCGRVFSKHSVLQDHESIHRGVRKHHCNECNRHFTYKYSYDRHMQVVHNDARAFICEYCHKSFKRKTSLRGHLRLHTGEKPYQCEFCSERFAHQPTLQRHKQKDHLLTDCLTSGETAK